MPWTGSAGHRRAPDPECGPKSRCAENVKLYCPNGVVKQLTNYFTYCKIITVNVAFKNRSVAMREPFQIFDIDRKAYSTKMADNLPVLRAKLGLSQEGIAGIIGITRQTISSIENKSREMSWTTFLSLLFLFSKNSDTQVLMKAMGIYDENLEAYFTFTDLGQLK